MDYEKKYKEALKRAKEKYTKCYSPALLDYIFPELKENKDKEIRKDIIRNLERYIKCMKDRYDAPSAKDFVKEIEKQIAWLEKQSEQESIDSETLIQQRVDTLADIVVEQTSADKDLKNIKNDIEIPFGAKDSELQEATYFIPKGFYAEIDDDKVVIKKGEKPAAWSEDDENILKDIKKAVIHYYGLTTQYILLDWLKSIKQRIKEYSYESILL